MIRSKNPRAYAARFTTSVGDARNLVASSALFPLPGCFGKPNNDLLSRLVSADAVWLGTVFTRGR